jgi:hypothetical protein
MLRRQATSKALKIEVDDTPSSPAVYTVNDTRQDPNMPSGTVAVEARINHQP